MLIALGDKGLVTSGVPIYTVTPQSLANVEVIYTGRSEVKVSATLPAPCMTSAGTLVNTSTPDTPRVVESLPSSRSPLERESRASGRNMPLQVMIVANRYNY